MSHHGILSVGTKEELIIRIGLLKCGQQQAVFSRESKALVELISMFKELLGVEGKQNRQGILTQKRVNASNEMSLMTTREAASAKKETLCPPRKTESCRITETLDFLEKNRSGGKTDAICLQKIFPGFREIRKWSNCKKSKDSRFFHKTALTTKSQSSGKNKRIFHQHGQ